VYSLIVSESKNLKEWERGGRKGDIVSPRKTVLINSLRSIGQEFIHMKKIRFKKR